jgi:hypothetical protein
MQFHLVYLTLRSMSAAIAVLMKQIPLVAEFV